jgi:hypothetical protein
MKNNFITSAAVVLNLQQSWERWIHHFWTAKGVENGKTIILERQDESGMTVAVDTVKVENGKFEIKENNRTIFYAIN